MKVVFMGTPSFAIPTFEALCADHHVAAVVTQPDKPAGRGKRLRYSPVKEAALSRDVPVLQPAKVKEAEEALAALDADLFVVVAYGQILPESVLNMPRLGCLNVHGSLLPKYRGAAPVHHAIMNGDAVTGVTVMLMDKGMDTGDMLLKKEMPILPEDTTGTLLERMAVVGADALIETVELMERGAAARRKQDDALASYARMITKEMGHINWNGNAADIANLVRALNPSPGAYALYDGQPIKIWAAVAVDHEKTGKPGQVMDIVPGKGPVVQAAGGWVLCTQLQGQGGKRMSAADYLRGHGVPVGSVLY